MSCWTWNIDLGGEYFRIKILYNFSKFVVEVGDGQLVGKKQSMLKYLQGSVWWWSG